MRQILYIFTLFFIFHSLIYGQNIYQTDVKDKLVKTLQVHKEGDPMSIPYIMLNEEGAININFDVLHDEFHYYAYSIIHCDANWQQSSLSPIEYMNGFQGMPIDDFANAVATSTQYTNYQLTLPNKDINFKISGNYAVNVYEENNPERVLLTACFYICDPLISIATSLSSNTDIDTNKEHQQVSFSINHPTYPIAYPQSDLKIRVYQNNRIDNAVNDLQPSNISTNKITYEHNRNLIFEAGNEYRRFEFLSNTYNGMNVQNTSFHNPYYHIELMTDLPRSFQSYQYDQDQNGYYLVNCSRCSDPDTDADYHIVHFTLLSDLFLDGNIYILSNAFNNTLNEKNKMGYSIENGQYEKAVLLKQGLYNYQYIFVPHGDTQGTTSVIEGNYYETENEYCIFVYHRPINTRYDQLIGIQTISSRN